MSPEKIDGDALLRDVNIVNIVSERLSLSKRGAEYYGICPFHDDHSESLQVNERKQIYKCFACDAGGDAIDFLRRYGLSFKEAVAYLSGEEVKIKGEAELRKAKERQNAPVWKQIKPISPPTEIIHYKHGKPSRVWTYRDGSGKILGYVCRFDFSDGKKDVIPFTYCTDGARKEWRWHGFEKPRPLYNLQAIIENQKIKSIIVVEGEKTADACQKLIKNAVVTTWIGGSKAIAEADWSPLEGCNVILWPDNDFKQAYGDKHEKAGQIKPFIEQPGNAAMLDIENLLSGKTKVIKWVRNPEDAPDKWDIADAKDWTADQAVNYVRDNLYTRTDLNGPPAKVTQKKPEPPKPAAPEPPEKKEPPSDHHDEEPDDAMPFRFLGFDKSESGGQRFYFFVKQSSTVFSYSSSSLSKVNLMTLAPISFWEMRFMDKRGINLDAAQAWIIHYGSLGGPFDESRIRGRGAWVDKKNVVLHGGTKLVVNGRNQKLKDHDSRYIYEAGRELGFNIETPLSTLQANALLEVVKLMNWDRAINPYLFVGWCILAPVCGALKWRPHIWLTGAAGTGKSWVFKNIVRKLLGQCALSVQSETTEAGIRQLLGHDALPVVFDEAEGADRRDSDRIQTVLNLMRAASAEDGGIMAKGSAGGTAKTYRIRSCFAFASIAVGVYLQSDRSRVSVLGLNSEPNREIKDRKWKELQLKYREVITEEFCDSLRARTIKLLPVIIANAATFSDAVAYELGEQRAGDQLGTLLAGAFSVTSDKLISYVDACAWVKAKDWTEEKTNEANRDELALFAYLMDQVTKLETAAGTVERSVGELVKIGANKDPANYITPDNANERLKRIGMKTDGDFVLISNTSDWVKKALANTQWSKNHNKILQRIPDSENVHSTRFASGVPTRAVRIPLRYVIEETPGSPAAQPVPGNLGKGSSS